MPPRSFVAPVALLLLLVVAVPAAGLQGAATADRPGVEPAPTNASVVAANDSSLEPGAVEIRVDVAADGDARWRVSTAVAVNGSEQRDAFADLVAEFEARESPLGLDTFRSGAAAASETTGRPMEIEAVERNHTLYNGTGSLWVSFTWTNFGRTSGDRLAVGDAFNGTDGPWLSSLSEQQTLVVVPPAGYGVSSAPTGTSSAPSSLSNGVAVWEGAQYFGDRGPWIVYSGDASVTPTPTPTSTRTPTDGGPGTTPGDGGLASALPVTVLLVLAGASAAFLAYRRRDEGGFGGFIGTDDGESGSSAPSGTEASARTGDVETDADTPGEAASDSAADDADTGDGTTAKAGADATDDDPVDEELLSDEERVERLIERNGGRMKQASIVKETGWSNAKVSQLLSAMAEDGQIDKLRIGRENLITFPDEDVTDFDSE